MLSISNKKNCLTYPQNPTLLGALLTLLHSERPKLYTILAFLSAKRVKIFVNSEDSNQSVNLSTKIPQAPYMVCAKRKGSDQTAQTCSLI